MKYCNNCDIVYETKDCPLCCAKDEIKGLTNKIERLEKELEELRRDIMGEIADEGKCP